MTNRLTLPLSQRKSTMRTWGEKKEHEEKRGLIQPETGGPDEEVILNWILNAKKEFVALFYRNRELLWVSEQKGM